MMGNRVPKSVKDLLMENEKIISKVTSMSGDFIATDRRVIRFGSLGNKSKYSSIEYDKISIKLLRYNMSVYILRVVLAVSGLLFLMMAIIMLWGPTTHSNGTTTYWGGSTAIAVVALVLFAILFWFALIQFYRHYQIEAPGMHRKELRKWSINRRRWGASNTDEFARIVREEIARAAKHQI